MSDRPSMIQVQSTDLDSRIKYDCLLGVTSQQLMQLFVIKDLVLANDSCE